MMGGWDSQKSLDSELLFGTDRFAKRADINNDGRAVGIRALFTGNDLNAYA